jgi:hypothetical protein
MVKTKPAAAIASATSATRIDSRQAVVWVAEHRGKLSQIAKEARVSAQFAHQVLRGLRKSKDGNVERILRREGAPVRI